MHPDELTLNLTEAARAVGRPRNYFARAGAKYGVALGRVPLRVIEEMTGRPVPDDLQRMALPFGRFQRGAKAPRRGRPCGNPLPGQRLLSIPQAALELNVSRRTIYRMADAGELRIVTIFRGCAGIARAEVERLLAEASVSC